MNAVMKTGNRNDFREIESSMPERYPRGWFCLGLSDSFRDGKPHQVRAFGQELVVFEGQESKKLNVLNTFCPHLGANLAEGYITGDAIACPFHDWRWAGDGKCAGIPYAKRVPPRARTRAWMTCEQNRQLFIWNDPEGNPPPDDVFIPRLEGAFSDEWSDWDWSIHDLDVSARELVDNMVDVAHFFYVHGEGKGGASSYFKNIFENHFATQILEMGGEEYMDSPRYPLDQPFTGDIADIHGYNRGETTYHGPGYLVSRLMTKYPGQAPSESYEILANVPTSHNSFRLHMGFITRNAPGLTPEQNAERAKMVAAGLRIGTLQDVHIWETKTKIDNPLLCDSDGPIYQLRRWFEQFFVDVADIKPEMVNRFEAETDTRHALPIWEKQAAENIARAQQLAEKAQQKEREGFNMFEQKPATI